MRHKLLEQEQNTEERRRSRNAAFTHSNIKRRLQRYPVCHQFRHSVKRRNKTVGEVVRGFINE
jgi:hypothetical protein